MPQSASILILILGRVLGAWLAAACGCLLFVAGHVSRLHRASAGIAIPPQVIKSHTHQSTATNNPPFLASHDKGAAGGAAVSGVPLLLRCSSLNSRVLRGPSPFRIALAFDCELREDSRRGNLWFHKHLLAECPQPLSCNTDGGRQPRWALTTCRGSGRHEEDCKDGPGPGILNFGE